MFQCPIEKQIMPHSRNSSIVTVPTVWHYFFFCWTLELFRQCGIIFTLLDFGTVPRVWHHLFFYETLELTNNATWSEQFQSSIEKQIMLHCRTVPKSNRRTNNATWWNCSDSVPLFVFLLDFGTVPIIWHYFFFYWTLILFRQCGIIFFSVGLWNCSDSVALFLLYWTLELFPIENPIMPHCRKSSKVQ
jgi:hypothetical protein